ncbi:tetratricopeptide repeat protein, partial [Helicobacter sp. NHP22-001]|uniref:tetratricopeptide repeat protein n=1 Tax=Helicobacter sp. NHP22-001 TaxID=3040202 RepID=UPI0025531661
GSLGNASGYYNLALLHSNGEGVIQSYLKAVEYYQKAIEIGHAGACFNLGLLYYNGRVISQDYSKAIEYYQKATELGNSRACINLGNMYLEGQGVSQDYQKALGYYKKAAEMGDTGAYINLGFMYYNGQGVPKDHTKAIECFKRSADEGNADARFNLTRLRDKNNLILDLLKLEIKEKFVMFAHMTEAIIYQGIVGKQELLEKTLHMAIIMDGHQRKWHRYSRQKLIEQGAYETALAMAATVLQGAHILATHNQDEMLESDLRMLDSMDIRKQESMMSLQQVLNAIERYL